MDSLHSLDPLPNGTLAIPIPPDTEAIRFDVGLTNLNLEETKRLEPSAFAYIGRHTGGTAFIKATRISLSDEARAVLEIVRDDYRRSFLNIENHEEDRFVFISELPDHPFRGLFDLSR